MKRLLVGFLLFGLAVTARAALVGEEIAYHAGDTTMKGYLAYDDSISGPRPAVLVVHEWWGHNAYARKRADMLAEMGYVALAVDMYGEGKQAEHPDDAGKFAGAVRKNMPVAEQRFNAAMELLRQRPEVAPDKMAAIGYCFGGGIVLEMARRGVDLDAVASFHGSLGTGELAQPGKVSARVRVFNGADDPMTSEQQLLAFHQEMSAAEVDYDVINYPGVKHSFTNPQADDFGAKFGLPLAYNAEADKDSWAKLGIFLKETFSQD